jgi:hypothetical protein
MRKRPSIDTSLAKRRPSKVILKPVSSKSALSTPDILPTSKDILTPQSAMILQHPARNSKTHNTLTGVISPTLPEIDKETSPKTRIPTSAKVNKVAFQFPEGTSTNPEVNPTGNLSEVSEFLSSARESLYNLRQEAKMFMSSNRKLANEVQKSRRGSFLSDDFRYFTSFCQSEMQDPMRELSESIEGLKVKVIETEKNMLGSQDSLKEAVLTLERNVQVYQDLKLQRKSNGCGNNCIVF